jgi:hypothetical protein
MSLQDVQVWLDTTAEIHQGCTPPEGQAVTSELTSWVNLVPPTFAVDMPATLSKKCADALKATRADLAELPADGGNTARFGDISKAATEAFTDNCTLAEQRLFTAMELDPPQRRAGSLPRSSEPPSASTTTVAADPDVKPVDVTAELSQKCADAVAPVRQLLADSVGKPMPEAQRDQLASGLAAAVPFCTPDELASFQSVEVGPALGLESLAGS